MFAESTQSTPAAAPGVVDDTRRFGEDGVQGQHVRSPGGVNVHEAERRRDGARRGIHGSRGIEVQHPQAKGCGVGEVPGLELEAHGKPGEFRGVGSVQPLHEDELPRARDLLEVPHEASFHSRYGGGTVVHVLELEGGHRVDHGPPVGGVHARCGGAVGGQRGGDLPLGDGELGVHQEVPVPDARRRQHVDAAVRLKRLQVSIGGILVDRNLSHRGDRRDFLRENELTHVMLPPRLIRGPRLWRPRLRVQDSERRS